MLNVFFVRGYNVWKRTWNGEQEGCTYSDGEKVKFNGESYSGHVYINFYFTITLQTYHICSFISFGEIR